MKRNIILISILTLFVFQACKKHDSPGDNSDFSNSLPSYVTIRSFDDIEANPGDTVRIVLQMRTSLQQAVTATYKMEGAINIPSATIQIPKEAKTVTASFILPANIIVPPATSASAVFTLLKAETADGVALTIGHSVPPAKQKVNVLIEP